MIVKPFVTCVGGVGGCMTPAEDKLCCCWPHYYEGAPPHYPHKPYYTAGGGPTPLTVLSIQRHHCCRGNAHQEIS